MADFWMTWVEGRQAPARQHLTEAAARAEAERLARLQGNVGQPVHVLRRIATCRAEAPAIWDKEG